jgi:hypothetical protein
MFFFSWARKFHTFKKEENVLVVDCGCATGGGKPIDRCSEVSSEQLNVKLVNNREERSLQEV